MKAIRNKILVRIDTSQKERYDLGNGTVLSIEKGYNFNLREDRSSMAFVIDGENLPEGAKILIHHNATDETYRVDNNPLLTDEEKRNGWKVLSIPKDMAFCYNDGKEWVPCKDFLITQRIFKPYKGALVGIEHEKVKNRLYVVKGSIEDAPTLEGKVCMVTENSDYEIIFTDETNRPKSVIRTRAREIMGIDNGLTDELEGEKYLVGISQSDAKPLKQNVQAS